MSGERYWDYYSSFPIRRLAAWCAILLVLLRVSAIQQVLGVRFAQHIPTALGLAGVVWSGGLSRIGILRRPMVFWLAFYAWVAASVPFSEWPGGSFAVLRASVVTSVTAMIVITGSIMTWAECRRLAYAMAASCAIIAATAKLLLQDDGVRVSLSIIATISNANDLAAVLVLTAPFVVFVVLRPGSPWLLRCAAIAVVAFGVYIIVKTASRGALLSMAAMGLIVLLRSGARQRVGLLAGGATLLCVSFAAVPDTTLQRLFTFSSNRSASEEALMSQQARVRASKLGLVAMFRRPIFGIGAGNFPTYANGKAGAKDGVQDWHEIHNAYLRAGAEAGIPALIFYTAPLVWLLRHLGRIYRRAKTDRRAKEIADLTHCFTIAMTGFSVAMFFLPWQFDYVVPVISSVGIAIGRVAARELSVLGVSEDAGMRRIAIWRAPAAAAPLASAQAAR